MSPLWFPLTRVSVNVWLWQKWSIWAQTPPAFRLPGWRLRVCDEELQLEVQLADAGHPTQIVCAWQDLVACDFELPQLGASRSAAVLTRLELPSAAAAVCCAACRATLGLPAGEGTLLLTLLGCAADVADSGLWRAAHTRAKDTGACVHAHV